MLWTKPMWLIGGALSLEGMRRGFVGGCSLAIFVAKTNQCEKHLQDMIELLSKYLVIEAGLLNNIPPPISFLLWPFMDYHDAAVTYLQIMIIIAEEQKVTEGDNCEYYWNLEEETV